MTLPYEGQPWTKQPWETQRAFECFCVYRDMGTGRSLREAYREEAGKDEVKQVSSHWARWSSDHNWVERAEAWDQHILERKRKEREREIEEMYDRHINAAQQLFAKAYQRIMNADDGEMSLEEARRALSEAVEIERRARGEPDQVEEQRHTADIGEMLEGGDMDDETRAAILAAASGRLPLPDSERPREVEGSVNSSEESEGAA